jgi:MFS family permease
VALMLVAQLLFAAVSHSFAGIVTVLAMYFVAFNVLEASLPSIISKIAPASAKGTAMGVYNTSQSFGFFVGGALGGWLSHQFGPPAVFLFGAALMALWLLLTAGMKRPPAVRTLMFHLPDIPAGEARQLQLQLAAVPGVTEATVLAQEGMASVKVDRHAFDELALRRLLPPT